MGLQPLELKEKKPGAEAAAFHCLNPKRVHPLAKAFLYSYVCMMHICTVTRKDFQGVNLSKHAIVKWHPLAALIP